VRNELLKFHSEWYSSNIMAMAVLGQQVCCIRYCRSYHASEQFGMGGSVFDSKFHSVRYSSNIMAMAVLGQQVSMYHAS
jgi:hypothetical protein